MSVMNSDAPQELKDLLKDIKNIMKLLSKTNKSERKKYDDAVKSLTKKLHPRKDFEEKVKLQSKFYDEYNRVLNPLIIEKEELLKQVINYYKLKVGIAVSYKGDDILTQITTSEVRFKDNNSIEIQDLPSKIESGELVINYDIKTEKSRNGYWNFLPKTQTLDSTLVKKREDIINFIDGTDTYMTLYDDKKYDTNKEYEDVDSIENEVRTLIYNTRENGSVNGEQYSIKDYKEAVRLSKLLSTLDNIKTDIETVDEWVHLNITIE